MSRIAALVCLVAAARPAAAAAQAADTARTATPPAPQRTVQFTGLVLVNGFWNSAGVNNVDLPLSASQDVTGVKGLGADIRQTRLQVFVTDPDVLGGQFSGEVDADFYGGYPPSGGRTFPLLRLRRLTAAVDWSHLQVMVGQEVPLVSERNPRSLAAIGFPEFSGSGNLWLWIPQARVTFETGYTLRLAVQAAALAPTANGALASSFAFFSPQPDSAERTGRPFLESRLRLAWGPTDDPSEVAVGGHLGWIKNLNPASGDSIQETKAVTGDFRLVIGPAELLGEVFTGQALNVLGGGGVAQNFGAATGAPVRTTGGWVQLNLQPVRHWMFGGGCGVDDPKDGDVAGDPNARLRNLSCEGHLQWRPEGPLVFGFEFRRIATTYPAGEFRVNHMNLAVGYRL